jgi:CubicO group peptidase (beta-lactamase class C family)
MLMQGFPPPADARVTLANWQLPPYNRWSFSHMRELVPTQRISRGQGPVTPLPADPQPLGQLTLLRVNGTQATIDEVLDGTYTDAAAVVHGGRVVFERYAGETAPGTPHLLMSISKSFVSCVVGNLVERGLLSPGQLITDHVPELEPSGYRGASLRNVLDMRSGVDFSEDYTDLNAEVRIIEEAMGWRPPSARKVPPSMYAYLTTLGGAGTHGGVFDYRSCETDVLGWVCERAAGTRMADLVSELVWAPMGAEHDAEITCDGVGTAIHDGGMCATARDLARFGTMLLAGGEVAGRRVVPAAWLRESWTVDPDVRGAFAQSVSEPYLPGGWYRNKFWFVPRAHGDVLLCLGINGQMLYVAPGTGTVAAKLSTWPDAQSPTMLEDTLRAFDAAGAALAGLDADDQRRHGPPGVAAGLSRGRIGGGSPALRACCDRYGHVARVTAELPRVMDERERG